jgi:hypothetical protein
VFGEGSQPIWNGLVHSLVDRLRERLASLPDCAPSWPTKADREATITVLSERLAAFRADAYE